MNTATIPNVTEDDFLALPESKEHIELVDGEIILSDAPSPAHQEVVIGLVVVLKVWADQQPSTYLGLSPLDVRLASGRVLQPDLFVFLDGRPWGMA